MPSLTLPVAEWAPDMPDLSATTDICMNAVPRSPESYGPFSGTADYSSALDGTCLGAIGLQDTQEGTHVFAGSADKIYKLDAGGQTWADVSGGTYSLAASENWRFVQWKDSVIAAGWGNALQTFNLNGGTTFGALSATAPQARFAAVIAGFLMVGNTYDPTGGYGPFRCWWSAQNDPTNWPTPGSAAAQQVMSDYNDLAGPMGDITGLAGGMQGCDGLMLFQRGVYRIVFAGPPNVFDFQVAEGVRGTRAPNSLLQVGGLLFYLGEDGFYAFDGATSIPIGANKVDKWFYGRVNQNYLANVIATADVINKAVLWAFPSVEAPGGAPDMVLIYNWQLQRWGVAEFPTEWLLRLLTFGTTMDSMASAGYGDLDTVPYSLDSRVWIGGAPSIAAFNPANHKLGFFNGTNLQAQIGSQAGQMFPGQKAMIQGIRPLVDGGAPTVAVSTRDALTAAETFGPEAAMNAIGDCPQRATGRYTRARLTMPAGASWTHLRGFEVTARPAGVR